jgi:hypothetical protein
VLEGLQERPATLLNAEIAKLEAMCEARLEIK